MNARLALQIMFAIGWTVGYVLWARAYYRTIDPLLRRRLGTWLGVQIIWTFRQGSSGSPLHFGPRYATWMWGIAAPQSHRLLADMQVYVLFVLIVPVLAGLWPVALLLLVFLGTDILHPLVALPLLFLVIPIYAIYWSGRYAPPGFQRS